MIIILYMMDIRRIMIIISPSFRYKLIIFVNYLCCICDFIRVFSLRYYIEKYYNNIYMVIYCIKLDKNLKKKDKLLVLYM